MANEVLIKGRTSRTLPQAVPNPGSGEGEKIRSGLYGELYALGIWPTKHLLADEGAYFIATNPTIGTGVAHALVTAFTNTAALFYIKNLFSPGPTAKRIYLDYLRLILTAAPTAGVSLDFLVQLDTTARVPTANNVQVVPVNVNSDDVNALGKNLIDLEAFNAGSLTVPAPGNSAINVCRARIPTGINVVGDEYVVQFGGPSQMDSGSPPLTAIRAAQPARMVTHAPPVIIGPGQAAIIYRWSPTEATAAPSYEYELGLVAR
jgi:hypothetical protein